MNIKSKVTITVACLVIALSMGCEKKAEQAPSAPQPQAQTQPAPAAAQPQAAPAFSASQPPALVGKTPAPGGKVNLDALNKNSADATITVKSEDGFDINGWAFDDKSKTAPELVFIELASVKGGEKYYAAANRSDRGDLATTFKVPAYKNAGYNLKADVTAVPAGEYQINIVQVVNGSPILADTTKKMIKAN